MPVSIDYAADEPYDALPLSGWMIGLAAETLASEGIESGALSVMVTDDETVRSLNREFRGYDQTTDVLSFGLSELARPATDDQEPAPVEFALPPDAARQLGEVVIAFPTAARQAAEHSRTTEHELAHLLIHGVLHLLGHDHYEPEEEREMRAREEQLLLGKAWERGLRA